MNYFKDCKTIHEAKMRFRELAKKHHPDAGGDAKVFAEISNQMDAFNPSQPEHSNFFGSSNNRSNQDINDHFQRAYDHFTRNCSGSGYIFNTSYRQSFGNSGYQYQYSIPFDHPIHEEKRNLEKQLREANENARYFADKYDESKTYLRNSDEFILSLTKEIESLKSQIEVLSRPVPVTSSSMLDKIRSYFEKQS